MSLSKSEFCLACSQFVESASDWKWNSQLEYCSKEEIHMIEEDLLMMQHQVDEQDDHSATGRDNWMDECAMGGDLEDENDIDDEINLIDTQRDENASKLTNIRVPVCFKYHILYSEAFQVPVLYFSAWNTENSYALTTDQILRIVAAKHRNDALLPRELNPYIMITQGEHPIFSTIFYYIHPCETAKLMTLIRQHKEEMVPYHQYIRSWLSFVGRLVLLELHLPSLLVSTQE